MEKYLNYFYNKINKKKSWGLRPLSGRNYLGRICCHHKSGGNKKKYYLCDFIRRYNSWGYLIKILKNTNYTSYIGIVILENGLICYNLLSESLNLGSWIFSGSYFKRI